MKVIKQSAQLLDRTGLTEYQGVELIGRTCYKSENLMTDESAPKFVTSLAKSGHHAMLEFGFIYMRITDINFWEWFVVNIQAASHLLLHTRPQIAGNGLSFLIRARASS